MNSLIQILQGIIVIVLIVALILYVLQSLLLSGLNKKMYGKGTILAWIPICNTYLLGKLVVNKGFGFILILWSFASTVLTFMSATAFFTNVVGQTTTPGMISPTIATGVSSLYNLTTLILFIVAIVKFFTLKKQTVDNQLDAQPLAQTVNNNQSQNPVVLPTSEDRPTNNYYVNNQPTTYEDLFVEKVEELSPEEQQKQEEVPDLGIFNQSADMLVQNQTQDQNNTNNSNNTI